MGCLDILGVKLGAFDTVGLPDGTMVGVMEGEMDIDGAIEGVLVGIIEGEGEGNLDGICDKVGRLEGLGEIDGLKVGMMDDCGIIAVSIVVFVSLFVVEFVAVKVVESKFEASVCPKIISHRVKKHI